jgi:hypothetical protein
MLDAMGAVDVALDRVLDWHRGDDILGKEQTLRDLLAARGEDANVATLRRMIAVKKPSGPQAQLIYELLRALPATVRTSVYAADPELEARLKQALPVQARDADFGPDLKLDAVVSEMRRTLDDADLWSAQEVKDGEGNTTSRLQPTTRSLLISLLQAGAGSVAAEVANRYRQEWMTNELTSLGLWVSSVGVSYDKDAAPLAVVEEDSGKWAVPTPYIPPGAEAAGLTGLSLEWLLQWLTKDYATWIELDSTGNRRGAFKRAGWGFYTVVWWPGGYFEVSGPGFDIARIDSLLDGKVFRAGSGMVVEWRIHLAPESTDPNAAQILQLSADSFELRDIFFGMEGLSVSIARLAATGVQMKGDTSLGPGLNVAGKVLGTLDLLYAIMDGLVAISNLVVQTLKAKGDAEGAAVLASDILARLQGRFASTMAATSVNAEGLVVGYEAERSAEGMEAERKGALLVIESVSVGDESSPWQAFVLNTQSGADAPRNIKNWDRLLQLRALRDSGALSDAEREEMARLEQDALEVILSVSLSRVDLEGVRLAVTDSEKQMLEARVEEIAADRLYAQADVAPFDETQGASPHDLDASGEMSPLEALRAAGDGSPEARLMQFHTIVHGLEVTRPGGPEDSPALALDRLHFETPTGDVAVDASILSTDALELAVLAEGFVPETAAHPSFPAPIAGDRSIHGVNLQAGAATITIGRVDKLLEKLFGPGGSTEPRALLEYLRDVEGDLRFVVRPALGDDAAGLCAAFMRRDICERTMSNMPTVALPVDVQLRRGGALTITIPANIPLVGMFKVLIPLLNQVDDIADLIEIIQKRFPDTTPPEQAQAERDALRQTLEQDGVALTIDALRSWLEQNGQANVEVQGSNLTWRPLQYDSGPGRTLTIRWGNSGGVPLKFAALAADGPIILELTVLPFELPSWVTGRFDEYYFAARGLHVDASIKATVRLLDQSPDKIRVEIDGLGLRELLALGRGPRQ